MSQQLASSPSGTANASRLKHEAKVDLHLQKSIAHTEIAEKAYAPAVDQYDRIAAANPSLLESEKVSQALAKAAGGDGQLLGEQMARAMDEKHMFDAGERIAEARRALKDAGLKPLLESLVKDNINLDMVKRTRDSFAHPEQKATRALTADKYPKAAEAAQAELDSAIEKLRAAGVPADKQGAVDKAVRLLEETRGDFGQFKKPEGYRLSTTADLTREGLEAATHIEEIKGGSHIAALKESAKDLGYKFNPQDVPGGTEPFDMVQGTVPGKHPLDALQLRRDNLAHLGSNPDHPGAVDRVKDGYGHADQLPRDRTELDAQLNNTSVTKPPIVAIDAKAANDPVMTAANTPETTVTPVFTKPDSIVIDPAVPTPANDIADIPTGARGTNAVSGAGGAVALTLGAKSLYDKFADENSYYHQDINADGTRRTLAYMGVVTDSTTLATGTIATVDHFAMATKGIQAFGTVGKFAGEAALPLAALSGTVEMTAAIEAKDGHRAVQAVGGTAGTYAGSAFGVFVADVAMGSVIEPGGGTLVGAGVAITTILGGGYAGQKLGAAGADKAAGDWADKKLNEPAPLAPPAPPPLLTPEEIIRPKEHGERDIIDPNQPMVASNLGTKDAFALAREAVANVTILSEKTALYVPAKPQQDTKITLA